MKRTLKTIFKLFQCMVYHINYHKGLYIGMESKVVGAKKSLSCNVQVMPNVMICSNGGEIRIDEGAEIGMYSRIASVCSVYIGKNVISGPYIFIADYNHEYSNPDIPIKFQGNKVSAEKSGESIVYIGFGTW